MNQSWSVRFYTSEVPLTFAIAGFLLGLLFGSFLNVLIVRVPRGESIVKPPSHCLRCLHPIRWYDNIPMLSWLLLRGRCRDCSASISWQYPMVEFMTACWFAAEALAVWADWHTGRPGFAGGAYTTEQHVIFTIGSLSLAILGFLLIGLIFMDWQTFRLPDAFTLSGIALGLLLVCCQAVFLEPHEDQVVLNGAKQLRLSSPGSFAARGNVFLTGPENLIWGRVAAVCGAALLLLLVRWTYQVLRKRPGLGLGDVKMLAMIAAFLGFWPAVLTLFLGVFLATLYAIPLMLRGQANALTKLPLGSFLGIAGLYTALDGNQIIHWYTGLLR